MPRLQSKQQKWCITNLTFLHTDHTRLHSDLAILMLSANILNLFAHRCSICAGIHKSKHVFVMFYFFRKGISCCSIYLQILNRKNNLLWCTVKSIIPWVRYNHTLFLSTACKSPGLGIRILHAFSNFLLVRRKLSIICDESNVMKVQVICKLHVCVLTLFLLY